MNELAALLESIAAKATLLSYCIRHRDAAPISCGALWPLLLVQLAGELARMTELVDRVERDEREGPR